MIAIRAHPAEAGHGRSITARSTWTNWRSAWHPGEHPADQDDIAGPDHSSTGSEAHLGGDINGRRHCKLWGVHAPATGSRRRRSAGYGARDGEAMGKNLLIFSKSVPSPDEDVITISRRGGPQHDAALTTSNPKDIGALYVGSESHPYAVKPTGTIVAEAIEASPNLTVADYEFACKAGTAAIQTCMGLVGSGMVKYGVAIGADTSQGAPGTRWSTPPRPAARRSSSAPRRSSPSINPTFSYTTDTPDFWRREGQPYPSHGGRFTGEPAYFKHIMPPAQGPDGDRRDEAHRLQVRRVPPAQRQVPVAGRQAAGIHRAADRGRPADAVHRQHLLRRGASGTGGRAGRGQTGRPHLRRGLRFRRRLRTVSTSPSPTRSRIYRREDAPTVK